MPRPENFLALRRRICTWDLDPRRFDSLKPLLERQLSFLPQVDWHRLKSLDDPLLFPCDLLVTYAWHLAETELVEWLRGFEQRMKRQDAIWIPALVITPLSLTRVDDILERTLAANWYFDLVHPDHLSSLPVRVANLLRIHDHLHELGRYASELTRMQEEISRIEQELEARTAPSAKNQA